MPVLNIDGLVFTFPENWQASKYDEWSFYRNQFIKQFDGIKAVDIVVLNPEKTAFIIEVKDYRHPNTEKPSELPQAIANKVLHTLAGLFSAKLNATELNEQQLAAGVLECTSLKIIVHIEQAQRHRPVIDLADVKQKLKKLLRAIDAHPKIVSMNKMANLPWIVAVA